MPVRLSVAIVGLVIGFLLRSGTGHGQEWVYLNPSPRSAPERGDGDFDVLPERFADMNQYDQIAMEPYRDRYDSLPLAEKAELYARQFEFMRNRPPRFAPEITDLLDDYEDSKSAASAYKARQHLYKPATPKTRASRPNRDPAANQRPGGMPALSGPWSNGFSAIPESEPEPPPSDAPRYSSDGTRMENLRRGWNAADVMRGSRTH